MKRISAREFYDALARHCSDESYDFIDVCTPQEYQEKHIQGVRNVPMDRIPSVLNSFEGKMKVYVQCRSGRRSEHAGGLLEQLGVSADIVQVDGGLLAWEAMGFPVCRGK